jgi:peptidoglycan/LPS O-acetylase OafA/YrhL
VRYHRGRILEHSLAPWDRRGHADVLVIGNFDLYDASTKEPAAHVAAKAAADTAPLPSYRPDVDGLRAVAVLAVLVFHAFPHVLPGGFVGVDVFFVISGYLITGIIQPAVAQGAFSLAGFYRRRIRRIFPALLLVLAFSVAAGHHLLLADEFRRLGRQIVAGASFASNFLFWSEAGYFDTESGLKPLLHLWSLGIEEQFYIVWPLLLMSTHRFGRRALPAITAVSAVSLLLCLVLSYTNPTAAFYSPFSRAWELGLGGMLAFPQMRRRLQRLPDPAGVRPDSSVPGWLVWTGALLILVAVLCLDRYQTYPGAAAMLPTLGTALLLAAGPRSWFNAQVLSRPPLVGIGLISYPLYLWHWPLLAFLRIASAGQESGWQKLLVLALSMLLAWMTWHWLELPVRRRWQTGARPLLAAMTLSAALGLGCALGAIRPWSASFDLERIVGVSKDGMFPAPFMRPLQSRGPMFYQVGTGARKLVFIGDSTMQQYSLRIQLLTEGHPDTSAILATASGCMPVPGIRAEGRRAWCRAYGPDAYALAMAPDVETVVIGAAWYRYLAQMNDESEYVFEDETGTFPLAPESEGARKAFAALGSWVSRLRQGSKKVYLISDTPFGAELDPAHVVRRSFLHGFEIDAGGLDQRRFLALTGSVARALAGIAKDTGAMVIDPVASLCDGTVCPSLDSGGYPRYRDSVHFIPTFARDHVTYLDVAFGP